MAAKKPAKKPSVSPEAAKILEQYRNAGKPASNSDDASPDALSGGNPAIPPRQKPSTPAMRRSGTRGK